jgi:hypothetical protein
MADVSENPTYSLACPREDVRPRRCCFIHNGDGQCVAPASFRVQGTPATWDDYTLVCDAHLSAVKRPGDVVGSLDNDNPTPEDRIERCERAIAEMQRHLREYIGFAPSADLDLIDLP